MADLIHRFALASRGMKRLDSPSERETINQISRKIFTAERS
jgi:hypothetical protein